MDKRLLYRPLGLHIPLSWILLYVLSR
jgi:hypothetical protein